MFLELIFLSWSVSSDLLSVCDLHRQSPALTLSFNGTCHHINTQFKFVFSRGIGMESFGVFIISDGLFGQIRSCLIYCKCVCVHMNVVSKVVIKAKGGYFEESQIYIYFDLFNTILVVFI